MATIQVKHRMSVRIAQSLGQSLVVQAKTFRFVSQGLGRTLYI